jgi:hypothetical protein
MATSTTIPKPENIEHDEILKRVGRVQRERLRIMYKRAVSVEAAAALSEYGYYAQLLENCTVDFHNKEKKQSVLEPKRPGRHQAPTQKHTPAFSQRALEIAREHSKDPNRIAEIVLGLQAKGI